MAIPGLVVLAGALWQAAPLEALPLRAEHAIVVGEALQLREAVGDAVWPGFAGVECPIVLQPLDCFPDFQHQHHERLVGLTSELYERRAKVPNRFDGGDIR